MRVRCPHCENPIDLVPSATLDDIACPSCGSHFSLLDITDETETVLPEIAALRNFELMERVGVGHFGTVWKARDTTLQRFVAIKLPHRQNTSAREAALFFHEAQSASALQHPNIVTVHEVGRDENRVFIVSQFIEGNSLKEWVKTKRPDFRRMVQICGQIGNALHHAHEKGVVHRDLKPENILVDSRDTPFITDFGLAKRDNITYTIAVNGQPLGTPAYMPPEQARGEGNLADRRSDTYSLGVILYEMLTGQRPFSGGKHLVLHQIIHSDPRPPRSINRQIPRDLETICLKALAKNRNQRYQTAEEMVQDLERFLRGEPIKARPVSVVERAYRWARRKPAAATAIALAVLLLALLPFVFLRGDAGPTRRVRLNTVPSEAQVIFIPLDGQTGIPIVSKKKVAGRSPIRINLPPNEYLVVAYLNDRTFHEVYRHVPGEEERAPQSFLHTSWSVKDGTVILPDIHLHATRDVSVNMVKIDGGDLSTVDADSRSVQRNVPDFYVDANETTIEQLRIKALELPLNLNDTTSQPDAPLTYLTHDEAVQYAELLGARLLDYAEYRYLAQFADQQTIFDAVRANESTALEPAAARNFAADQITVANANQSIVGIFSSVDEWASNWFLNQGNGKDFRMLWTGFDRPPPATMPDVTTRAPTFSVRYGYPPTTGMRCARSIRPRLEARDFIEAR